MVLKSPNISLSSIQSSTMVHGILYSGIIQSTVCDDTRHSAIDATTLNGLERHHTLDSQLSHDLFDGMY